MSIGPNRNSERRTAGQEIERLTQEFIERGGEIDRAGLRVTKSVDLTYRNYAQTAMEGVEDE